MTVRSVRLLAGLLALATMPAFASAQELNWAEKMFSELKHDFGVVARGADVEHRIQIKNPYEETVRITNVKTTCGCTAAEPSARELTTGEVAYVTVKMDTQKFMREKDSNVDVTMTFDGGAPVTVRIPIHAYIRTDVVLTPGGADFGDVAAGEGAERIIHIAYAGRPDWQIEDVVADNPHLEASAIERHRAGSACSYELTVKLLPSAPVGTLREQILVKTNDASSPTIPVLVEATVEPDIIVTPTPVNFGSVTAGGKKTVNVVVRGRRAFAIDEVLCESERSWYEVALAKGERTVHIVPLTVEPPAEAQGEFSEEFTVVIPGRDEPVTFPAIGVIR